MTGNGARDYEDVSLNTHRLSWAVIQALPRMLFVTSICCGIAFAALFFMTREYTAETSVLLEPRNNSFAQSDANGNGNVFGPSIDNAAIASQIQLLRSRETLLSVIDDLNLRSDSNFTDPDNNGLASFFSIFPAFLNGSDGRNIPLDEQIINILREGMVAVQARDSRVISIKYTSTGPQTAANVANALAGALVRRRSGLVIEDTSYATRWLDQEIARLSEDVLDAENRVANFRVENDLFRAGQGDTLIAQQLSDLSRQISAVSERKNAAATRALLIRDLLKTGQSLISVPDVRQSPVVQRMSEQQANFKASRAQAAATLLDDHPTIRALDAQILDIEDQINQEARRIANSLETQARIEEVLVDNLKVELDQLKSIASGAERSGVELAELEREAVAKRNLLNTFLARQNEATARTNTGAIFPDVRIISTASAPSRPSWPNKPMILGLVAAISLTIQCGMVVIGELASGRLLTVKLRDSATLNEDADRVDASLTQATPAPVADPPEQIQHDTDLPSNASPEHPGQVVDEAPAQAVEPLEQIRHDTDLPSNASPEHPGQAVDETSAPVADPVPSNRTQEVHSNQYYGLSVSTEFSTGFARRAEASGSDSFQNAPHDPDRRPDAVDISADTDNEAKPRDIASVVDEVTAESKKIILTVSIDEDRADSVVAEKMLDLMTVDARSVVILNAGGADQFDGPGITDMCDGVAGFGTIIRQGAGAGQHFVSWGSGDRLDFNSSRFHLLIDALRVVYDHVIIACGQTIAIEKLVPFADSDAMLLLVKDRQDERPTAELMHRFHAIGIHQVHNIVIGHSESRVA